MKTISILLVFLFAGQNGFAWGPRGHSSICETATHLVQNQDLKEFLMARLNMMGHLCNIPDTYWKGLSSEFTQAGNPGHYINPEVIGLKVNNVPLSLKEIKEKYKKSPRELGSNWWRADQLYRVSTKKIADYDDMIFNFMTYAGVMGHFVGDNAQPIHVTHDYDGYEKGHGGIHSYYESDVVDELPLDLNKLISNEAQSLLTSKKMSSLLSGTVIERMKALAILSEGDIDLVIKADKVLKPSIVKSEKGMEIKTRAERVSPKVAVKNFKPLIIKQMARASLLLAGLWDQAYLDLGKPDLKRYKSYKYPFTPEFIMPDYE